MPPIDLNLRVPTILPKAPKMQGQNSNLLCSRKAVSMIQVSVINTYRVKEVEDGVEVWLTVNDSKDLVRLEDCVISEEVKRLYWDWPTNRAFETQVPCGIIHTYDQTTKRVSSTQDWPEGLRQTDTRGRSRRPRRPAAPTPDPAPQKANIILLYFPHFYSQISLRT
eukprot:g19466.t1